MDPETFARNMVKSEGIMKFLNKMSWEEVCAAYMTPESDIVDHIDMEEHEYDEFNYMMKLRLKTEGESADILMMRAALTSEALKVSGLTYTLRESAQDEEDTDAIHIHIVTNDAYWKVAKYGCLACSECEHQFDDWTTNRADGGRKRRPVVSHPLKEDTFRVLPCGSCPVQFRKEFESRMAKDTNTREEMEEINRRVPDTYKFQH